MALATVADKLISRLSRQRTPSDKQGGNYERWCRKRRHLAERLATSRPAAGPPTGVCDVAEDMSCTSDATQAKLTVSQTNHLAQWVAPKPSLKEVPQGTLVK